jgi:demethoxyubiquinone hydroxylase (CLK1/Coq7/Cat5 family)
MQTNSQRETKNADTIEKLQECLRTELSAVETYELALKSIDHVGLHHTLQEILTSHGARVERLRGRLGQRGAEAPKSSGIWGAFAKVVQAGADLIGDRAAIAALEEGEDRALQLYSANLGACDAETRRLFTADLLPEQQRTHELCRTLKSYINAPS